MPRTTLIPYVKLNEFTCVLGEIRGQKDFFARAASLICENPIFLRSKGSQNLKTFGRRFTQKMRIKRKPQALRPVQESLPQGTGGARIFSLAQQGG
jgi:hypothetical protein